MQNSDKTVNFTSKGHNMETYMTDNNFSVGLRLSLEVNNSGNRIDVTLAGWLKSAFVIATGPRLRDLELTSNDVCIIRFLKDGVAFGFQTTMLVKHQYPAPMIYFTYPEKFECMVLRRNPRVKTNIPAKLMKRKGDEEAMTGDARIVDLSKTGCMLEIAASRYEELERNENCCIAFMILDKSFEIACSVKDVRKMNGNYRWNLEFSDIDQATRDKLELFVSVLPTEGPSCPVDNEEKR